MGINKVTIDKHLPIYFAGASGDFNLIHIDQEHAKQVGLEGVILHGSCTLGIVANQILGNSDPGDLKSIKVRFASPVFPEDELTIESERLEKTERFTAKNQHDKQVITNGVAVFR